MHIAFMYFICFSNIDVSNKSSLKCSDGIKQREKFVLVHSGKLVFGFIAQCLIALSMN
jgi:hypothetical protein